MKGIIYIPYANGSAVHGFKYDKPLSASQYVQMETKEYDEHKNGVDYMMKTRYGDNMSINMYQKRQFNIRQQKYFFHECRGFILDIDAKPQKLQELKDYAKSGEQFVLILNLDAEQIKNDDFLESELKMWFEESMKVKNCNRLSDAEVMFHLPKKDFKIKIDEENITAVLKECKFLKFMSTSYINSFAIIVNKIIFVKE